MSGSLRILTYNVQMRSWGMEAGAQQTLTPVTSVEERAKRIAHNILNHPQGWDVLCFNEVFDEDGRDVLIAELGTTFPNQVRKADKSEVAWQVAAGVLDWAALSYTVPLGLLLDLFGLGGLTDLSLLAHTTFEDSGVMIFSKVPFATHNEGYGTPKSRKYVPKLLQHKVPSIFYIPYDDAAGGDRNAAKGCVYVQLDWNGTHVHVLATHTQSDGLLDQGNNHKTRTAQLTQAVDLLKSRVGDPPWSEEVILCGDFNIDGFHEAINGPSTEWKGMFGLNGTLPKRGLHDAWHEEQSPGPNIGGPLLGPNFDRGATIRADMRLDYMVRNTAFPGRLLAQHICSPYEVALSPSDPAMYVSDHRPLSLDLCHETPHGSVQTAEKIEFLAQAPNDRTVQGRLVDGQMHWYFIDIAGAYEFTLKVVDGAPTDYEVYTADNLSVPLQPFSLMTDSAPEGPPRTRFVLPSAPFFIRVFQHNRIGESSYSLSVHKFTGTSKQDAIPLCRGLPTPFEANPSAPHSLDDASTPWDTTDGVWFCAPWDTRDDGSLTVTSTVSLEGDPGRWTLFVSADDAAGAGEQLLTMTPPGGNPLTAEFGYDRSAAGFIVARREGGPAPGTTGTITLTSDVSYLYTVPATQTSKGGPAVPPGQPPPGRALAPGSLLCIDETNGFAGNESGSDDIQINVSSQGQLICHIPNSDQLEFDDETDRNPTQLDGVRYVGSAKFELVELDDLSAADRASVELPAFSVLAKGDPRVMGPGNGSSLQAKFRIQFDDDDGIYDLTVTVSQEPPPQPRRP